MSQAIKLPAEKFYKEVDELVATQNMSYMDAIIHYCEKNSIEIEAAATMIKHNSNFKSNLQEEGENLNFLPKTNRLPL